MTCRVEKAVVLLSGGLDSTTVLAIAKDEGFEPWALTFRYGQRHDAEIEAAQRIAAAMGVAQHLVMEINQRAFAGSAPTAEVLKSPRIYDQDGVANSFP